MAKEKSDLSKEERRALKKSKKEEGSVDSAGISKPKSDKKKTKEEKAKRTALAERALNEVESRSTSQVNGDNDDNDDDEDDMEVDKVKPKEEDGSKDSKHNRRITALMNRPVGALVPFANPLVTEDKNVKKIFKSVKKGSFHRYPQNLVVICYRSSSVRSWLAR